MSSLLVSVIMPVYNSKEFLAEAIESVLEQTYPNWELVIVDDGSPDSSYEIAEKYQQKDSRIVLHKQKNGGPSSARNTAVDMAKGELIAMLDPDDVMFPSRLQEQVDFLHEHPEVSIVSCLCNYVNRHNKTLGTNYTDILTVEDCHRYIKENKIVFCLHSGATLYKDAFLNVGGYKEDIFYTQDLDLWNRLVESGYDLVVMPKILVNYRIHGSSIMSTQYLKIPYEFYWVRDTTYRRRSGRPELEYSEYLKVLEKEPFMNRLRLKRSVYYKYFYRTAGLMYAEKKYLNFLISITGAFLLNPLYVFQKLTKEKLFES